MPKVSPIKWKVFEKFLLAQGCVFVRQDGSHRVYHKKGILRPIVLPAHTKEIPVFVIKSNLRTLGISTQQYVNEVSKLK